MRVAINGFGRIGRTALRIMISRPNIDVVAVNDLSDAATLAHLLKYDSNYGIFDKPIAVEEDALIINNQRIKTFAEKDPKNLPWSDLDIDVVIESTGKFCKYEEASQHLTAGAKRVIISAPGKGEPKIPTYVRGVNDDKLGDEKIISNASCTTNCIAPMMAILEQEFGIESALMTTAHGYTNDQRLQDDAHKDLRRARAAAVNIIPTTTGAAKSAAETIPSLTGKFDGVALRVPVAVGSISDITAVVKKSTTVEEVNNVFRRAATDPKYHGILTVTNDPIVSSDIIGSPYSAIVDLGLTRVIGNLVKVFGWYDNEYGYTMRLVEMAEKLVSWH